jgi:beta-1,4-mannosyl-glycoprotein beta-1,4-N-acetylglucosaminyltransferase
MTYEAFMFFQENDLLEVKLNQHWNFVDKFIIVEAGETHTGIKKDLIFDHERFKKYSEKIIYRSFNSFAELYDLYPNIVSGHIYKTVKAQPHLALNDWMRDTIQAEYLTVVLLELQPKDSDIILFTCLDEILNEEAFSEAHKIFSENKTYNLYSHLQRKYITTSCDFAPTFGFDVDMYAYKLNLYSKKSAIGCMTLFSNLNKIKHTELRYYALSTHDPIKNAGWHFTFLDDTRGEKALKKYKSWAHSRDGGHNVSYFDIETPLEAEKRVISEYNTQVVEISSKTHPKWLIDNISKYSSYIYSA